MPTVKQPNRPLDTQTELGKAFTHRLRQIGLSRRELERRSGLSRQTLHNIEHGEANQLPATLAIIDEHLRWREGTALALQDGDTSVLNGKANHTASELAAKRLDAIQRIVLMSEDELETLITQWADQTEG